MRYNFFYADMLTTIQKFMYIFLGKTFKKRFSFFEKNDIIELKTGEKINGKKIDRSGGNNKVIWG